MTRSEIVDPFSGLEVPPPSCVHGPLRPVRRDDGIIERWEPCPVCTATEQARVAARQIIDGMAALTGPRGVRT